MLAVIGLVLGLHMAPHPISPHTRPYRSSNDDYAFGYCLSSLGVTFSSKSCLDSYRISFPSGRCQPPLHVLILIGSPVALQHTR